MNADQLQLVIAGTLSPDRSVSGACKYCKVEYCERDESDVPGPTTGSLDRPALHTACSCNSASHFVITAEKQLQEAQKNAGYPLAILQLVANAKDPAIRQAAAVIFKNLVKKAWDENNEDGDEGIVISPDDRNTIKSHLVQLMCTVPSQIQAQLSETISLIAAVDYPHQWTNLLPELVQQFNSTDSTVLIGVLKTANSIFKRFRYVQRSDQLYEVILYTLQGIQAPLLTTFKALGQAVDATPNDCDALTKHLEALRLISRIFFSLNYQDLPEFFEDHMGEWMADFAKYMTYQNPVLISASEEDEPSPIDKLQVAIIQNLNLYANKDEEAFMEYLPKFTELVWNLLLTTTAYPKHDTLATTSIRFLSELLQKVMHKGLFEAPDTLRQIVLNIVIPNLMFRESDEERFEGDPREYIMTEVEGSDSESRRRCSQDLLRSMCRHFEAETTQICQEHVVSMLAEYSKDPVGKWAAKDAAVS
jgi:exportin-2 (importin alpha re-exporter)